MVNKMSSETAEFWILKKVMECRNDIKLWRNNAKSLPSEYTAAVIELENYLNDKAQQLKELRHGW